MTLLILLSYLFLIGNSNANANASAFAVENATENAPNVCYKLLSVREHSQLNVDTFCATFNCEVDKDQLLPECILQKEGLCRAYAMCGRTSSTCYRRNDLVCANILRNTTYYDLSFLNNHTITVKCNQNVCGKYVANVTHIYNDGKLCKSKSSNSNHFVGFYGMLGVLALFIIICIITITHQIFNYKIFYFVE